MHGVRYVSQAVREIARRSVAVHCGGIHERRSEWSRSAAAYSKRARRSRQYSEPLEVGQKSGNEAIEAVLRSWKMRRNAECARSYLSPASSMKRGGFELQQAIVHQKSENARKWNAHQNIKSTEKCANARSEQSSKGKHTASISSDGGAEIYRL